MKNFYRYCSALFLSLMVSVSAFATGDDDAMPVLRVNFNKKEMPKEYILGTMQLTDVDGSVVEMNARFKMRGATAQQYSMKPSFNMKLRDENDAEKDTTLLGLRSMSSWILDAMAIDRINMRNRVCFDVWNEFAPLPYKTNFDGRNGTAGRFVEVYINNTYKGIYCMTDRINRKLLDLKKPEVAEDGGVTIRGVMYKHGTNTIHNQNSVCYSDDSTAHVIEYHDAWELMEPEDYAGAAAWAPLHTMYANRNNMEWIRDHFYLQQLADYQVFILALCIEDNWGNKNSIISARNVTTDGNKHRFVYTPWDLDTSLGGAYNGNFYDGNYTPTTPADLMKASTMPVPFYALNQTRDFRDSLRLSWDRGRRGALSLKSLRRKMYAYRNLFIKSGAWQRSCDYWAKQKYKPCYVEDLNKEVDLILDWYKNRIIAMDNYFGLEHLADEPDITIDDITQLIADYLDTNTSVTIDDITDMIRRYLEQ